MKNQKAKTKVRINCNECKTQSDCCQTGAWIDLEEAKRIVDRGIQGVFYHLEKDKDYPSGYRVGTSFEDNSCSFLDPDGLCAVHKVDYALKPRSCKEFPYEGKKLSCFVDYLCTMYKSGLKKRSKPGVSKNKK